LTGPRNRSEPQYAASPLASVLLTALGILVLIMTPLASVVIFAARVRQGTPMEGGFIMAAGAVVVLGVALGGILVALAALVRHAHQQALAAESSARARHAEQAISYYTNDPDGHARHRRDRGSSGQWGKDDAETLISHFCDIRDLMQVDTCGDSGARERLRTSLQRAASEGIISAINTRRLGKARELLGDAEAAYGKTATLERLHVKIDEAEKRNEPLDYAFTKRVVESAMANDEWSLAERCVQALYFDHSGSVRCRRLWEDTRRARLYAHIQSCADEHLWAEALAAAEEFLGRFPASLEADALREEVPTLRANAEILQRKQYEVKFKELISSRHYREALRIAKHVVDQFPKSPQALALRDQIPLLEKRAAG